MEGSIKLPEDSNLHKNEEQKPSSLNKGEIAGKIADQIDTGKNAKDSFIWMTITWSFYIASGISILMFARSFFLFAQNDNLLDALVNIWSVFISIITLALGYAFGKGE